MAQEAPKDDKPTEEAKTDNKKPKQEEPKINGSNYIEIEDDDDFDKKIKDNKDKFIVIDFGAEWCNPCKMIEPLIKKASSKYVNVIFLKVDIDECLDSADDYGVKNLPTIKFIKNGEIIGELVGAGGAAKFEDTLKKHCG